MRIHMAVAAPLLAAVTFLFSITCSSVAFGAEPPSIQDESTSAVTTTGAILGATIDPEGQATTYHFEYATQAMYEKVGYAEATSVPIPAASAGSDRSEVVEGQQVTGLEPATTYHYRVIVTNLAGVEEGRDQTFTTLPQLPPFVATLPAIDVSQQTATLDGTVESGLSTVYEFDLGADTSYGTRIFGEAIFSSGVQTYGVTVQGLEPGSTYHYRLLARNSYGTSYGTDQVFTTPLYPNVTLIAPSMLPLLPAPLIMPAPKAKAPKVVKTTGSRTIRKKTKAKGKSNAQSTRRHVSGPAGAAHSGVHRGGR